MWQWTDQHEDAMQKLKDDICSQRVLAYYDVNAQSKISADASMYGLGAVFCKVKMESPAIQLHLLHSLSMKVK